MAVLRIARFKVDPANTEEMLAKRDALVTAIRDGFSGLLEARLAKLDDQTWIDVWRWDSLTSAQTAADAGPTIPQAGAAFALVKDISMEYAEVVAER